MKIKRLLSVLLITALTASMPLVAGATATTEYQPSEILYSEDFEGMEEKVSTTFPKGENGGIWEIMNENGNKILRMKKDDTQAMQSGYPIWRNIALNKSQIGSAKQIVYEYKTRNNFTGSYAYTGSRKGPYWGVDSVGIYRGNIIMNAMDGANLGKYNLNEWVTITNIYDVAPDTTTGEPKAKRYAYINGEYAGETLEGLENNTNGYVDKNNDGSSDGNFQVNFRIEPFDADKRDQYADIAYSKVFVTNDNFNAVLPLNVNTKTESININFNNIPKDLTNKITVKNTDGTKASDISDIIYIPQDNVDSSYESQYKLVFATPLNGKTTYKLAIENLEDSAGNILNKEMEFTTAKKNVVYSAERVLYSEDFEGMEEKVSTTFPKGENGGIWEIKNEEGNKFLRMKKDDTQPMQTGYPIWRNIALNKSQIGSAKQIVYEYKTRNNLTANYAYTGSRNGPYWGASSVGIYHRDILMNALNGANLGKYNLNEWVTITNVYDVAPDTTTGEPKAKRYAYIDGKYVGETLEGLENNTNGYVDKNNDGSSDGNFQVNFRMEPYDNDKRDQYADIAYSKVYVVDGDKDFAAQLANPENVSKDGINIRFNNIPKDLDGKITVCDKDGNKVSDISVINYVPQNNIDKTFASEYNLVFDTPLDNLKDYDLVIEGAVNSNGDTLSQKLPFKTKAPDFEYGKFEFMQNGASYVKGSDFVNPVTVNITVSNNSDTPKNAEFIVAGYIVDNMGIVKMISSKVKDITLNANEKDQQFTSELLDISGLSGEENYFVKAFLWEKDITMKPIIPSVQK